MSFCSRHLRQSTYCVALGNFSAPKARCFSLTSQSATTFCLETTSKCASARPHVPNSAMFNLLLGASAPKSLTRGRISAPAPIRAVDFRNWRRFMERVGAADDPTAGREASAEGFREGFRVVFILQSWPSQCEKSSAGWRISPVGGLTEFDRRRRVKLNG